MAADTTVSVTNVDVSIFPKPTIGDTKPPKANDSILVVKPIWTAEAEVLKMVAIDGRVGRHISVTNGPNAVSNPKNKNKKR